MSKINGTLLLLYADGVVIAAQRGCSISVEQDLPDASNKDSAGWGEHINGLRTGTVEFTSLMSTTGLSASELMDYIISRSSLLLAVVGGITHPLVAEVDLSSVKIDAPQEAVVELSGSLRITGPLYQMMGTAAGLITDPDANGTDYDTLTISGIAISSGINLAGTAYANSNTLNVTSGDVIKVAVFLTLNSGQAPSLGIWDNTSAYISNVAALVAGLNIVTLTLTGSDASSSLRISNSGAANWSLSSLYAFKYVAS